MLRLEDVAAQADAAAMAAEQTCCILEHKYIALSENFSDLQCRNSQLSATLEERLAELSHLREENHKAQLSSIRKDEENERLRTASSELRESKRRLMELVEQKEVEMSEKNVTIKSHLDKILHLTKDAAFKEARIFEVESEVVRTRALYNRVSHEKELLERHNSMLKNEWSAKSDDVIKLRRAYGDFKAEMSGKLEDGERRWNESCVALKWNKDRVTEMETKLDSIQKEFVAAKDDAASSEKQLCLEIATLEQLVRLYKESSEEWSKKAGELEGVVKAMETHVNNFNERLEEEVSTRMESLEKLRKAELCSKEEECKRAVESCSELDKKLQDCLSEEAGLKRQILELKAELRRKDRANDLAQKMNVDLQNQVAILLKECRDIQLRCGHKPDDLDDLLADTEDLKLTLKHVRGLVDQNVQLRYLISSLSEDIVSQEATLKGKYDDEAYGKVSAVLARAEEQQKEIETLQNTVAMYKKLYEEESLKPRPSHEAVIMDSSNIVDSSNVVRGLEEELRNSRSQMISLRTERDKLDLQARLSQEKLERCSKEIDYQRDRNNDLIAKNGELLQSVTFHQQKTRQTLESLNSAEEISRKLTLEVSLLKQEKVILCSSEKRESDEACSLSERVHRLQASLDSIHSTERGKEEGRSAKKRKLESYVEKIERHWEEAKRDLQEERDKTRLVTLEREKSVNNALKYAEDLQTAARDLAAAEVKAFAAEARCTLLEEKIKSVQSEVSNLNVDEVCVRAELEKLVEEARISKDHMLEFKSLAQANEEKLKQLEVTYEKSKYEDDRVKKFLEADVLSLRQTVDDLQRNLDMKIQEMADLYAEKEEAAATHFAEASRLKESFSAKMSEISVLQMQIASLKDDLVKERKKSGAAQASYERQVSLHSDTIQELNKVSHGLNELQEEASETRKSNASMKNDNDELKVMLETEKKALEALKTDLDEKYDEVNDGGASRRFSRGSEDDGLQGVVKYLRRVKENSEVEISSLKQEKLRLQSQLETAQKAAERSKPSSFFSDEDFESLKIQAKEINLLRESNAQLREENRQSIDECQKLRETCEISRVEAESLTRSLGEKQREVEPEPENEVIPGSEDDESPKQAATDDEGLIDNVVECEVTQISPSNRGLNRCGGDWKTLLRPSEPSSVVTRGTGRGKPRGRVLRGRDRGYSRGQ